MVSMTSSCAAKDTRKLDKAHKPQDFYAALSKLRPSPIGFSSILAIYV
jgi:hypothetical protein